MLNLFQRKDVKKKVSEQKPCEEKKEEKPCEEKKDDGLIHSF